MTSKNTGPRIQREQRTVAAMVRLNCQRQHQAGAGELCPACARLLAYAEERLNRCVFGEAKPTCAKCPVHCYRPREREQMKDVMRRSGPAMLGRHPWLTLRHWLDGLGKAPAKPTA